MKILKPKKCTNGTYEGNIYSNSKKDVIRLNISNAFVVGTNTHNKDFYLLLKNKTLAHDVFDINQQVIDYVKDHCESWFSNGLSNDLIDDYFTTNIVYDKQNGQVIKFKCVNDDETLLNSFKSKTHIDITLTLKYIRFYKQKFIIEWEIENTSECNRIEFVEFDNDDSDSLEDIPMPIEDDLISLKEFYTSRLNKELDIVNQKQAALVDLAKLIAKSITFSELSHVCDELDNLLE